MVFTSSLQTHHREFLAEEGQWLCQVFNLSILKGFIV